MKQAYLVAVKHCVSDVQIINYGILQHIQLSYSGQRIEA